MTLLNVLLEPGRARVVCDSLTYGRNRSVLSRADGSPYEVTKFLALLHARVVMAVSGRCAVIPALYARAHDAWIRDFDHAAELLPAILRAVAQDLPVIEDPAGPYRGDVIHVVGWSARCGRMAQITWSTGDGFKTFKSETWDDGPLEATLQPGLPDEALGGYPASDEILLQLAHSQIRHSDENVFGGALLLAEITKESIQLREIGQLGVPGASVAAPAAEEAMATVVQRARVSWTPITDGAVNAPGGGVEVRYGLASWPESQWISRIAESPAAQIDVVGVQAGQVYLFKARAFNALVNGKWSLPLLHVMGTRSILVDTPQIAAGGASVIATAKQTGSLNLNLTETTVVSTTLTSIGSPIYLSASVDASGGYSARDSTFRLKLDGTTVLTKSITSSGDPSTVGNQWSVTGALLQFVIAAPSPGSRTIELTAVGSDATYGVNVSNCDLYCEEKRR
jgi:hypothetical protein